MKARIRAGVGFLIPFLPVSCSFCRSVWRSAGVLSYVFIPNPSLSICLFLARILGFIFPCTWKSPNNTESSSWALSLLSGGLGGRGKLKRTDSSGFWIPSLARKSGSIFPKEQTWGTRFALSLQLSTFPCPWEFFSMNYIQSRRFFLMQVCVRNSLM